jgi:hypothetical protein
MSLFRLVGFALDQCPFEGDPPIGPLDEVPIGDGDCDGCIEENKSTNRQASRRSSIGYFLLIGIKADLLSLAD